MKDTSKKFLIDNWFKLFISLMTFSLVAIYAYQTLIVLPSKEIQRKADIALNKENIENCISDAEYKYKNNWIGECSNRWAQKQSCYKTDGLKYGRDFCDNVYSGIRSASDCSLPIKVADSYDATLKYDKSECHKMFDTK